MTVCCVAGLKGFFVSCCTCGGSVINKLAFELNDGLKKNVENEEYMGTTPRFSFIPSSGAVHNDCYSNVT